MNQHLTAALKAIDEGKCERTTRDQYECAEQRFRSPVARYGDDRWCNSCIAHYALTGGDIRDFRPLNPVETDHSTSFDMGAA